MAARGAQRSTVTDFLPRRAEEMGAFASDGRRQASERVAAARRFDLDDLGPDVGQQGSREGRGDQGGDVEHPNAAERRAAV
jgi:hypothetical protein